MNEHELVRKVIIKKTGNRCLFGVIHAALSAQGAMNSHSPAHRAGSPPREHPEKVQRTGDSIAPTMIGIHDQALRTAREMRIHREGAKDAKLRKTGLAIFATFAPLR